MKHRSASLFYRIHNMDRRAEDPARCRRLPADRPPGDRCAARAAGTPPLHEGPVRLGRLPHRDGRICPRASAPPAASKFSGWKLWNFALEGITSFSSAPLEIWTYVGAIISVLSFLYGLVIVAKTLVFGIDVPGYASLLVSVLFLGGIQLLGIGIIGQYLGRVYAEIKQRPIYIVRRTFGDRVMELDAYRNMAATEDEHWWFCGRRAIAEAVIRGLDLPKDAKILEIGAGTGGNIAMLEKFGEVQAVEMSDLARQIAWEKTGREFPPGYLPDNIPVVAGKLRPHLPVRRAGTCRRGRGLAGGDPPAC